MNIVTQNGKKYRWIWDTWWETDIDHLYIFTAISRRVCFRKEDENIACIQTYHTPEQLVKLGYMELVYKTKPTKVVNLSEWDRWKTLEEIKAMDEVPEFEDFLTENDPVKIRLFKLESQGVS